MAKGAGADPVGIEVVRERDRPADPDEHPVSFEGVEGVRADAVEGVKERRLRERGPKPVGEEGREVPRRVGTPDAFCRRCDLVVPEDPGHVGLSEERGVAQHGVVCGQEVEHLRPEDGRDVLPVL